MGYEVEIKFRDADFVAITARLHSLGALRESEEAHEDAYLAHPSRDFAVTGEAFRIRREGDMNRITYKGAKLGGPAKTREELEVDFAAGDATRADLARIFDRLGFAPVAVVRKRRTTFRLDFNGRPLLVALDRAENLGDFAEVEALASSEADLSSAQAAVRGLADRLGLVEVEPRSYLRMLLEARGTSGDA